MNNERFECGAKRKGTNCIKWDALEKRYGKKDLTPFWVADSDYETPLEVKEALIERVKQGAFGYTFVDDEYKNIIVDWVKKRYLYSIEKEWIVPTPGVVSALYFAVSILTNKDASIIIQTPVYNPFYNVVLDNNRILLENKLQKNEVKNSLEYTIDYNDLEEKMKNGAEMLIFCNPHNPVGRVWKYEEVEKLVLLCKKYNCILVSDEIHCDIIINNNVFTSAGRFLDVYDKVIICTAPSKTFNLAGFSCANTFIKNELLCNKYRNTLSKMSICEPNLLGLLASKTAYSKCEYWLKEQLEFITSNVQMVNQFFEQYIPKAYITKNEGTYLLWINMCFLNKTSAEIVNGLLEEGIVVNSGYVYGEDYDGYIRFNVACPKSQLIIGLEAIKRYVNRIN